MAFLLGYRDIKNALDERDGVRKTLSEFTMSDSWLTTESGMEIDYSNNEEFTCCGSLHFMNKKSNPTRTEDDSEAFLQFQNQRWGDLHRSFEFISSLIQKFESGRKAHPAEFFASKASFDRYGAATMLLLRNDYRLFLLYLALYLTGRQEMLDEDLLTQNLSSSSTFLDFLHAVSFQELTMYSNPMKKYLANHPEVTKILYNSGDEESIPDKEDDSRRDFEELFMFIYKRDFFMKYMGSSFNTYSAAVVTDLAWSESVFLKYFQLSLVKPLSNTKLASFLYNVGGLKMSKHSPYLSDLLAQRSLKYHKPAEEGDPQNMQFEADGTHDVSKPKISQIYKNLPGSVNSWSSLKKSCDVEDRPKAFEDLYADFLLRHYQKSGCLMKCCTHLLPPTLKDIPVGKSVHSTAIYKAGICFLMQIALVVIMLQLTHDELYLINSYKLTENLCLKNWFIFPVVTLVCIYAFNYSIQTSVSEFANGTVAVFAESQSIKQWALLFMDFCINSLLSLVMVFLVALVLQTSDELGDFILNCVAVFFVVDLDDMLLGEIAQESMPHHLIFAYLGMLHSSGIACDHGKKGSFKRKIETYIFVESCMILIFGLVGITLLVMSFVILMTSNHYNVALLSFNNPDNCLFLQEEEY
mmetsp:Transcript_30991/g.40921  ORF Transcript_30991/g.40921 Transcript_30991/m.40921 type:complete len:638 (+) Transcript_30991:36-1949(+)